MDVGGNVVSGNASTMCTIYAKARAPKSRHVVVEKFGKVLWFDEKGDSVICFSPTHNSVEYDVKTKVFRYVVDNAPGGGIGSPITRYACQLRSARPLSEFSGKRGIQRADG